MPRFKGTGYSPRKAPLHIKAESYRTMALTMEAGEKRDHLLRMAEECERKAFDGNAAAPTAAETGLG